MGKKKQVFHAEKFQIVAIDALPQEKEHNYPLLKCQLCIRDFILKSTVWKEEKK